MITFLMLLFFQLPVNGIGSELIDSKIISLMNQFDVSAASITVVKDNRLLMTKAYGFADRSKLKKLTTRNRFRIASLTKPLTALIILQLVDENKIDLYGKLGNYFKSELKRIKSYDARVKDIRVIDLLNHRSGWRTNDQNDPVYNFIFLKRQFPKKRIIAKSDLLKFILKMKLEEKPGEMYSYSNPAYFLLGLLIEKASGLSYEFALKKYIAQKIGLKNIGFEYEDKKNLIEYNRVSSLNMRFLNSCGGLTSNSFDLAKLLFDMESDNSVLISEKNKRSFIRTSKKEKRSYLFGWNTDYNAKRFSFWHTGGMEETMSAMVRYSEGSYYIMLFNKRVSDQYFLDKMGELMQGLIKKGSFKTYDLNKINLEL